MQIQLYTYGVNIQMRMISRNHKARRESINNNEENDYFQTLVTEATQRRRVWGWRWIPVLTLGEAMN